jgi:hypothetical protein
VCMDPSVPGRSGPGAVVDRVPAVATPGGEREEREERGVRGEGEARGAAGGLERRWGRSAVSAPLGWEVGPVLSPAAQHASHHTVTGLASLGSYMCPHDAQPRHRFRPDGRTYPDR